MPAAKKAAKKAAPRTAGTPKTPPKARKVAAPAKPKAAAKASPPPRARIPPPANPTPAVARIVRAPARPVAPGPPPLPAEPAQDPWQEVPDPQTAWEPAPAPAFDPTTGAWLPAGQVPSEADPAAYRRSVRSTVMSVILGIDLSVLGLLFVAGLVIGIVLVAAPDSDLAQQFKGTGISTPGELALETLFTFALIGVIPFLWVLGTRVQPWLGMQRYFPLRVQPIDILRAVGLTVGMFVTLLAVAYGYLCATNGCHEPEATDDANAILSNLNWPVAFLVAACAGIGEEILFRGILRRHIGVWGQAAAFGLAHASQAYPPQVLFAFVMGVGFGYLHKRGWSLVTLILAHFLYDFAILSLTLSGVVSP